jgi:hypothetical protein
MAVKYLRLFKKWVYVALSLLIPLLFLTIIFASQNKEGDANQAPADVNAGSERRQKASEEKKVPRPEHAHPAFAQRIKEREEMVATQIQARDINDPNVLRAMRIVPRHAFVPDSEQRYAYADHPLPIGFDQTISQPYIVAFMT